MRPAELLCFYDDRKFVAHELDVGDGLFLLTVIRYFCL